MKQTIFILTVLFCCLAANARPAAWQDKIEGAVLRQAQQHGTVSCLLVFAEQADLSPAAGLATKEEKGAWVYAALRSTAERSQAKTLDILRQAHLSYQNYWVVNAILVQDATAAQLEILANVDAIAQIIADAPMTYHQPTAVANDPQTAQRIMLTNTWGIDKIGADQVWALGYRGQGVVVAGGDTGYSWTETPIKSKYRGWNGTVADHNYNWHDGISMRDAHYTNDNPYGYNSVEPVDDNNHGTHTMGTMTGYQDDAGVNIGVAPDARWIGCRNMERGWGMPSTYINCFQWFLAPTDLAGANVNTAKSPHVINNSWGCPPEEGCDPTNFAVMNTVITNVKAAGIVVVVSAGNSGSSCGSVDTPAPIFEPSFSVGATNSIDDIAGFSSRGPVTVDGSNRRKPNVSAPGVDVRSCIPGGGFANWNGTSMAGPHVAGAVALIISARPALAGQVNIIEDILEQTANHLTTNEGCGGDSPTASPNNTFGFGRIDVYSAVQAALTVQVGTNIATQTTAFANAMPNPAHNFITLHSKGLGTSTTLQLFNAAGQLLRTENIGNGSSIDQTLDLSNLPQGVYTYQLNDGQQVLVGRFVKE
jgi:serine protease AprX